MSIEKVPFVSYELDDSKKADVFSIRLNEKERAWLDEIKADLNIAQDGKALKLCAFVGRNVLHGTFSREFLQYLFKKDRVKLDDLS